MTQDEIIEMARQAGFRYAGNFSVDKGESLSCFQADLEAFAKLVDAKATAKEREEFAVHAVDIARRAIAEEREACEKACENERNDPDDQFKNYEDTHDDGWIDGCNSCIAAIRARGDKA